MRIINTISVSQRVSDTAGRATGFDYLRIILATSIVCWHSVGTAYGMEVANSVMTDVIAHPFVVAILPMFFSLSGFLVAGSLERSKTLFMFIGLRVIRIFPALIAEVLLSAIVIGPLLTKLSLADYFSSSIFFRYFYNVLGDIQYILPGVFLDNPIHAVNGQLWTVPWELKCYISIAVLTLVGAIRYRVWLPIVIVFLVSFYTAYAILAHPELFTQDNGLVPGWGLVVSFLMGVVIYLYSEKILWNGFFASMAGIVGFLLLSVKQGVFFAPIPIAYLTIYIGLLNPKKIGLLQGADYSYGIFLYGYVVQQAFTSLGTFTHQWWLNIIVCLPVISLISGLSWHLIEKPALKLRGRLGLLEENWISLRLKYFSWVWLPDWLNANSNLGLAAPEYRNER